MCVGRKWILRLSTIHITSLSTKDFFAALYEVLEMSQRSEVTTVSGAADMRGNGTGWFCKRKENIWHDTLVFDVY